MVGPLLVTLALSKVHAATIANPHYDFTASFRLPWAITFAVLLTIAAYGVGLPDLPRTARQAAWAACLGSVGGAVPISLLQLVVGDALLPRFVVGATSILLVPYHMVVWAIARQGRSRGEGRDRLVLVASSEERGRLVTDLALSPERPASLVAQLAVEEISSTALDSGARPLVDAVIAEHASLVVLDRDAQLDEEVIAQAAALHEAGVRVRTLVEFYGEWLGKLPVAELERASLFFDISEIHRDRYGRAKRVLDVAVGVLGMIPLALVVPFIAVGNLIANGGPLLYRQTRVGRQGHPFRILKFRTMVPTGSDVDTTWTVEHDPRITPFGRLLRRTHLDELPQMVNIVRGDLSVVGPRPEQPAYVTELSAKLPFYGMRHLVRPGLTGWAQVKYGYAGDESDALEKLQYEFFYLRHQGLAFDLRVIGRTARSVVGTMGKGR